MELGTRSLTSSACATLSVVVGTGAVGAVVGATVSSGTVVGGLVVGASAAAIVVAVGVGADPVGGVSGDVIVASWSAAVTPLSRGRRTRAATATSRATTATSGTSQRVIWRR